MAVSQDRDRHSCRQDERAWRHVSCAIRRRPERTLTCATTATGCSEGGPLAEDERHPDFPCRKLGELGKAGGHRSRTTSVKRMTRPESHAPRTNSWCGNPLRLPPNRSRKVGMCLPIARKAGRPQTPTPVSPLPVALNCHPKAHTTHRRVRDARNSQLRKSARPESIPDPAPTPSPLSEPII